MFLILIGLLIYFGLGIALMFVAYRWMAKRGRSWRARIAVVLAIGFVLWAIPYGDHTLGKIEFRTLCEKDIGLRIYRKESNVEGYRSPSGTRNTPLEEGYRFFEKMNPDGTVTRYTLQGDKRVIEERDVTPTSRYLVDRKRSVINAQITRSETFVVDVTNNEKLAEYVSYAHHGGWFARQLAAMHAYSAVCPPKPFYLVARDVLKPKGERD